MNIHEGPVPSKKESDHVTAEDHNQAFIRHLLGIPDESLRSAIEKKAAAAQISPEELVKRAYTNLSHDSQRHLMVADMGYLSEGADKGEAVQEIIERLFPEEVVH